MKKIRTVYFLLLLASTLLLSCVSTSNSPKVNSYPKKQESPKKEDTISPGRINLSLNFPSVQSFNWDTHWGRDNDNIAIATGVGMEYYLKSDLYLSGGIDGMYHRTNQMLALWMYDMSNVSKALQGKIQIGKKLYKQLWFDVGIQMNHSYWNTKEILTGYDSWLHLILSPIVGPNIDRVIHYKESKNNYGLAFGLKLTSRNAYMRIDYNPSFLTQRVSGWKREYNHIWGISFGGLIKLK
ncbi:hypothetical protein LJC52_01490 [Bacteroidales bacterium OttesenSCG-928-A17]|nr:hypothetical protein [Bacteroidales bacterium OttesenSCG-928-A17]